MSLLDLPNSCAIVAAIAQKHLEDADIEARLLSVVWDNERSHVLVAFRRTKTKLGLYDHTGTYTIRNADFSIKPLTAAKFWFEVTPYRKEYKAIKSARWI